MTDQNDKREAAIKRVKAKRGFRIHLAIYLVVNALLLVVWALSGARYFWPIPGDAGVGNRIGIPRLERIPQTADLGRRDPPGNGERPLASALSGPMAE